MKFLNSLRVKLTVLYVVTTIIPIVIIAFVMPNYYYQSLMTQDRQTLTRATLTSLTHNIDSYLDDLDRLTLIPYFHDDVMKALKLRANHHTSAELAIATQALYTTFKLYLHEFRTDIVSTIILPSDGSVFVAAKDDAAVSAVPGYHFSQQPWYKSAVIADGKVIYSNPHPQDYLQEHASSQVFSVARLIKDPDTARPLAVIMVDEDTNVLQNITRDIKLNVSSIIAIFGTQEQLIYSTSRLSQQVLQEIAHKETLIYDAEASYVLVRQRTTYVPWEVVILLSQSDIKAKLNWMYGVGILFAISGFCLTFLVFVLLSRWIINPFRHMMAVMKKVQTGKLRIRIVTKGDDEIAILGNTFNKMLDRINALIDLEYKAKLSLRDAEYRALQSQIEPHFLYNTLNGFIALNRGGQREVLEKAILSLSIMLRYILSNKDWVTLKDEFHFVERYCNLQKLRFPEKMTFVIECDEALANFKMPKVLLQPLVENAIVHGMEPAPSPCTLQVLARLQREHETPALWISIQDDGIGFDNQTPQGALGVGLRNVRDRLTLAYENASLSITSQIGGGTQVVIVIPLHEGGL